MKRGLFSYVGKAAIMSPIAMESGMRIDKAAEIEKARGYIEKALDNIDGGYAHNICGMALSSVSAKCGFDEANALIKEYCLDKIFGIKKMMGKRKGAKNENGKNS